MSFVLGFLFGALVTAFVALCLWLRSMPCETLELTDE